MSDELYLRHILDAICVIEEYVEAGERAFMNETMRHDGVVWRLATIGEAVKELSAETRAKEPEIPWRRIAGMRDRLIHGYASIDLATVWQTTPQLDPTLDAEHRFTACLPHVDMDGPVIVAVGGSPSA